ncbi:MAG TPA: Hpt domain-containing protein [Bacteroidales bacterium]|nr:Hpt domain-containing protein [Bacteroidales bacterium]
MEYRFINPEYLDSVSGGDPVIIKELVDIFREQVSEIVDSMITARENKDYTQLALLAHKVKSSVAIMGMADLATMLKTFDLKAREATDTGSYESYIERLRSDTASAIVELDDLISKRAGNS